MKIMKIYEQQRKSLMLSVKIDYGEVLKVVITELINKRNSPGNKIKDSFDDVLRYYLTEEEFQKYVVNGEELED
jgi:hypothetical protein